MLTELPIPETKGIYIIYCALHKFYLFIYLFLIVSLFIYLFIYLFIC